MDSSNISHFVNRSNSTTESFSNFSDTCQGITSFTSEYSFNGAVLMGYSLNESDFIDNCVIVVTTT